MLTYEHFNSIRTYHVRTITSVLCVRTVKTGQIVLFTGHQVLFVIDLTL